ncbi:hypothetical protein [Aneurinibacillus terranovensis]|uniref:hypothetical protein n=1 Tax=Aneurinibacillus terranovensis TaxID=278991 RepID=UPI0003F9BF50|nr:hypothetical protein [Aneurinibacillus terranovensis]
MADNKKPKHAEAAAKNGQIDPLDIPQMAGMADYDDENETGDTPEDRQWNPLDTPQIANSISAQRRLGRGAPMPGLYIAEDDNGRGNPNDGEENQTIDERLQAIEENIQTIKQGMTESSEKVKELMENVKDLTGRKDDID